MNDFEVQQPSHPERSSVFMFEEKSTSRVKTSLFFLFF